MKVSEKRYYFATVKLCCIIILIIYFVSSSERSLHDMSVEWFLLAVVMAAVLGFELTNPEYLYIRKDASFLLSFCNLEKFIFLCAELILTLILLLFFEESNSGLFLFPMAVFDTVIFFRFPFAAGLFSFSGMLLQPDNVYLYMLYCLFLFIIYYQNYMVIEKYREYLKESEREEYQLKDSIHSQNTIYKEQMEKSRLAFENRMLEEKSRLSQALHDKLGHSINGSVYQLEACKVLMKKEPEQSLEMIQAVIDNLRSSMDEIRVILRREKPDKKQMAYLQLVKLCTECREKYGIQAEIKLLGEDKELPELIWEVILDNSIEAVTNALKYAQCTRLSIEISILNKVVRCCIHDNGEGCVLFMEGMGIQGMKNRARTVNGFIDFSGNNGFHINMIIPLSTEGD